MSNQVYWGDRKERAAHAKLWIQETKEWPRGSSVVYDRKLYPPTRQTSFISTSQTVVHEDTVSCIMKAAATGAKVCALNFASFTNPGGKFLEGSCAQEESLCHESNLYHYLTDMSEFYEYNKTHRHYGFYEDRCIYSKGVTFKRGSEMARVDVLTCASPNFYAITKCADKLGQPMDALVRRNKEVLVKRVEFIRDVLLTEGVQYAVLGAFGCGVFKQDPTTVAQIFKDTFRHSGITCVYAIKPGIHDENWEAFQRVFSMTSCVFN